VEVACLPYKLSYSLIDILKSTDVRSVKKKALMDEFDHRYAPSYT